MREGLRRLDIAAGENHDVAAVGESLNRTLVAGGSRSHVFDHGADAERPGELVNEEGDRPVQLEILQRGIGGHHVEIEDSAEPVIADEEHRLLRGLRFDVDLEPVVAADEGHRAVEELWQGLVEVFGVRSAEILDRAQEPIGQLLQIGGGLAWNLGVFGLGHATPPPRW